MRLIFAGTPEPAVVALQALIDTPHHEVVAVLTRPDSRKGRGRTLHPSPVKELALKHNIPVLTPTTLRDVAAIEEIKSYRADCIPVVAYGNLVPEEALDVVPHGWVNLHFSLLPAWRGAAPVQAAIAAGDEITGATTFRIDAGLDTGPILGRVTEAIRPTDTADDLLTRLAYSGADLLARTMDGLAAGVLRPESQSTDGVSYAAKVMPEDAKIDWNLPAYVIDRKARAVTPAPGPWTTLDELRLKIGGVRIAEEVPSEYLSESVAVGQVVVEKHRVLVRAGGDTFIELVQVKPQGKKMMDASAWARGAHPDGKVLN